jgi:lipopolysaccharide export system permease protein
VFLKLTGLLLPGFFAVILPITTFVVTLFIYVRLTSDRELVVMRAGGLSQWQLARPALALAGLATLVCYALNLWLVPASQTEFRAWQFEIRTQLAAILVQEGVFASIGEELTVYARYRDPDGTLRGILVHDSRDKGAPVTVLAEAGRITATASGPRVTLLNGLRQQIEVTTPPGTGAVPQQRLSVLSFAENSLDLTRTTRPAAEGRYRNAQERSLAELLHPDPAENIPARDLRRFQAEATQRLANPLNALGFCLVALAAVLTGQFRRHGGAAPLVLGIGIMVVLLALGLMANSLAARDNALLPLVWLNTLAPLAAASWVLAGMPGRGWLPLGESRPQGRPSGRPIVRALGRRRGDAA